MTKLPFPCFLGIDDVEALDHYNLDDESSEILQKLENCPAESEPLQSYSVAKGFLAQHTCATRYSSYRNSIEKLLLWCMLLAKKPILALTDLDIKLFMEFCLLPPIDWVAIRPEHRTKNISRVRHSKVLVLNPLWKPFRTSMNKDHELPSVSGKIASGSSLAMQLSVVNAFYDCLCMEGLLNSNPAASLHRSRIFPSVYPNHQGGRSFSGSEWKEFTKVAEDMADLDSSFERKLLLLMTAYFLYLTPNEIASIGGRLRVKSLFRRDEDSFGLLLENHPALLEVRINEEFVSRWLARYRRFMGTDNVPVERDNTPLISTQSGRAGISRRHANLIFKRVCDEVVVRKEMAGSKVPENSPFRIATLAWVRETSLVLAASSKTLRELYPSIRGTTIGTAYNRFFAWQAPRG